MVNITREMTVIVVYLYVGVTDDEYKEAMSCLQIFSEPFSRVQELWRKTARGRLSFIHSDDVPALVDILQAWPRISDPKGYLLVRNEFGYCCMCGFSILRGFGFTVGARTVYSVT